jgi:hypothetical protein
MLDLIDSTDVKAFLRAGEEVARKTDDKRRNLPPWDGPVVFHLAWLFWQTSSHGFGGVDREVRAVPNRDRPV